MWLHQVSVDKNIHEYISPKNCLTPKIKSKNFRIGECVGIDQTTVVYWALYYKKRTYRKNSKIWDTSNNCHNCPKNREVGCNIELMHPNDADGMANSVDPDQTASSEAV